jgi:nucleoside-diphosphate-sugar epimerase
MVGGDGGSAGEGIMGETNDLHVVIGASGGTGSVLVRELVARGRRVRAINRSGRVEVPGGVEVVAADAADPAQMRAACRGAAVVYNCVNPPLAAWPTLFPRVMGATIAGAAAAGAILVFADDTWMYGPPTGPLTEDHPQRPVGRKGALRARLAATLLEAHRRGDVRAVIGRAPELYGPKVESLLGPNLFGAALAGRTARWVGALDAPHTPLFIDDFARGLATLGERPEALGAAWHIPVAPPITGRAFVHRIFEEAGRSPRVGAIGRPAIRALGLVVPVAREANELLYQFEAPYVVDSSKFARAFGGAATPHREGVRRTLAWYRQQAAAGVAPPWWRDLLHQGRPGR